MTRRAIHRHRASLLLKAALLLLGERKDPWVRRCEAVRVHQQLRGLLHALAALRLVAPRLVHTVGAYRQACHFGKGGGKGRLVRQGTRRNKGDW